MTTDWKDRAQLLQAAIRRALLEEWDPIGIRAIAEGLGLDRMKVDDEYDAYVAPIYEMLISGKQQYEVFEYLWWLETKHMSLVGDREATERFAARLMRMSEELGKATMQKPVTRTH